MKGLGLKSQQSTSESQHQEFNIQQEDFPALPRPQSVHNKPSKIYIFISFILNEFNSNGV